MSNAPGENKMPEIIRNCESCDLLGSDGDGPEYNGSWPVCHLTYCNSDIENEEDDNTNKPGFPFKTEQPCHIPAFWQYIELDEELKAMFDKEASETQDEPNGISFEKTFARFVEKYRAGVP